MSEFAQKNISFDTSPYKLAQINSSFVTSEDDIYRLKKDVKKILFLKLIFKDKKQRK